jgi:DNA-binding CsgD family transcriptional regulator
MQLLGNSEFRDLMELSGEYCAIGFGSFSKGEVGYLSSYPEDFQKIYVENNWLELDPVVQTCAPRATTFDWDGVDPATNLVLSTARDFGLRSGVSLSSQIAGSGLIVSYAGQKQLTKAAQEEAARLLHRSHLNRLADNAALLSNRQRELVALFAHGMRASQVAHYFERSEDAIKLRKRRIEQILGVNNFLAAVHVCAVAGVTVDL